MERTNARSGTAASGRQGPDVGPCTSTAENATLLAEHGPATEAAAIHTYTAFLCLLFNLAERTILQE